MGTMMWVVPMRRLERIADNGPMPSCVKVPWAHCVINIAFAAAKESQASQQLVHVSCFSGFGALALLRGNWQPVAPSWYLEAQTCTARCLI